MARSSLTGVLLMDAIVSSSLLALVVFFVLTLLPTGSMLLHQARYRGHALQWAQSTLENLERPEGPLPPIGPRAVAEHNFAGIAYHTTLEVTALAGESPDQLVQASCTVRWRDGLGNHQFQLGGYLARRP